MAGMSRNDMIAYVDMIPRRGDYRGPALRTRVTVDEFVSDEGRASPYIQVRIDEYSPKGNWHPSSKGITLRADDYEQIIDALVKAKGIMKAALAKKGGTGG
jgi:hypothetical protein